MKVYIVHFVVVGPGGRITGSGTVAVQIPAIDLGSAQDAHAISEMFSAQIAKDMTGAFGDVVICSVREAT